MGDRLKRFRRLERARQDAEPTGAAPAVGGPLSGRFAAIEPRGDRSTPVADPFGPPPEPARELLIAHDDHPGAADHQAAKHARAVAQLKLVEEEFARARAAQVARRQRSRGDRALLAALGAIADLGTPVRVLLGASVLVVSLIAADAIGPATWAVGLCAVAAIGASFFVRAEPP